MSNSSILDSTQSSSSSKYAPMAVPESSTVKSKFAPMEAPKSTTAPATAPELSASSSVRRYSAPNALPDKVAPVRSDGVSIIVTTILKGPHGIGLDISKGSSGRTVVQRFKELPDGAPNPALMCDPAIRPGDIIIGVNGAPCVTFMETVKMIKGSGERVQLSLERKQA